MSNKTIDKAKGRIKKAMGDLSGDEGLRREGATDEAKGNVKGAVDSAKRAAEEARDAFRNARK